MALLHAKGRMSVGDRFTDISIIGSEFHGQILDDIKVGDLNAIRPQISGRAWITGPHQHMLATDPWPDGYRLADSWPMKPTCSA